MSKQKEYSKQKSERLGTDIGIARGVLKRKVFFMLIEKCNMDICYQCGKKIEDYQHLSIEHKMAYADSIDPIMAFFDMDNIAFSHRSCNTAARTAVKPIVHGTEWAYNRGCRCLICVEKRSHYRRERKALKGLLIDLK